MPDLSHKHAAPDHPILDVIARRYSPYLFDARPVDRAKLLQCLEAARWAASSFNEQPWCFILAERDDDAAFNAALECLVEANQAWAKNAGALILTACAKHFTKNNKPNRVAEHDLGLAAANLTLQAQSLGLHVHMMAGVNLAKVRQTYNIPDTHEPHTAIAIGHAADPHATDGDLADRDRDPRTRKPLSEWVFAGQWGQAADAVR